MLSISNMSFKLNDINILKDVSLKVNKGDIVVLLGSSGSGKSTILKCINLLNKPNFGKITFDGKTIMDSDNKVLITGSKLYAYRSKIGKVFQHFNLFSHLTVLDNLMLAPKLHKKGNYQELRDKALTLLGRVGIKNQVKAIPCALSDGQKQRVAIVRALMLNPKLMLFDEPTSALDPINKGEIFQLIIELKGEIPLIFVTHEIMFAKKFATHIAFVNTGSIIEYRDAKEFFASPITDEAKKFVSITYSLYS